jgi:hypothetical protein
MRRWSDWRIPGSSTAYPAAPVAPPRGSRQGSPDRLRLVDVLRRAGATVPSGSTGPAVPIISRFIEGGASEFGERTVGDYLDDEQRRGEAPASDSSP